MTIRMRRRNSKVPIGEKIKENNSFSYREELIVIQMSIDNRHTLSIFWYGVPLQAPKDDESLLLMWVTLRSAES